MLSFESGCGERLRRTGVRASTLQGGKMWGREEGVAGVVCVVIAHSPLSD